MATFQIFLGVNQQYYFRFKASNGKQILSSESYATKQSCLNGISSVKRLSPFDISYRRMDNYGNYRFNMLADNGEIVAKSSEGYDSSQGREHAINIVKLEAGLATIIDLT